MSTGTQLWRLAAEPNDNTCIRCTCALHDDAYQVSLQFVEGKTCGSCWLNSSTIFVVSFFPLPTNWSNNHSATGWLLFFCPLQIFRLRFSMIYYNKSYGILTPRMKITSWWYECIYTDRWFRKHSMTSYRFHVSKVASNFLFIENSNFLDKRIQGQNTNALECLKNRSVLML